MEPPKFLLCVKNDEVEASLEVRKIYQVVPDSQSEKVGLVRIIDESGEDWTHRGGGLIGRAFLLLSRRA